MAKQKNLLTVDYHFADDTGVFRIGQIESTTTVELNKYIEKYGEKGAQEICVHLLHLVTIVTRELEKCNIKKDKEAAMGQLNTTGKRASIAGSNLKTQLANDIVVCKGSTALGTACGSCAKCLAES